MNFKSQQTLRSEDNERCKGTEKQTRTFGMIAKQRFESQQLDILGLIDHCFDPKIALFQSVLRSDWPICFHGHQTTQKLNS